MSPSPVAWALAMQAAEGDQNRIVAEDDDLTIYNTLELADQRQSELGRFTSSRFKTKK